MLKTLGVHFMEARHKGQMNVDIASMIFAWGLELNEEIEVIKWVMSSLFDANLLMGMDSFLEWAVLGVGYDVLEGIKDTDEVTEEGLILFVRWWRRIDRDTYKLEILSAWENLKLVLRRQEAAAR